MSVFSDFLALIARIPDWVSLVLLPSVFLVSAIVFGIKGRGDWCNRIFYATCALGFFLVCCEGGVNLAFPYLGLFCLLFAILRGIFSLRSKRKRTRPSRDERMYEKFHIPLEPLEEQEERIPKINCFEQGERSIEESGVELTHVLSLIEKLQGMKLSPADRLETDVILRRVNGMKHRKLSPNEFDLLNDCLASVLRMTAKYSL